MGAPEGVDGLAQCRWDGAQRRFGGAAERWGQAGSAKVLATPTPFPGNPNRAAEGGGNHRIGLTRCSTFQNGQAIDNCCGLCMTQYTTSLALKQNQCRESLHLLTPRRYVFLGFWKM
jgi:hypothetical protein